MKRGRGSLLFYISASLLASLCLGGTGCRLSGGAANQTLDTYLNSGSNPDFLITAPALGTSLKTASLATTTVSGTCTAKNSDSITIQAPQSSQGSKVTAVTTPCVDGAWSAQLDLTLLDNGTAAITAHLFNTLKSQSGTASVQVFKNALGPSLKIAPSVGNSFMVTYSESSTITLSASDVTLHATADASCSITVTGSTTTSRMVNLTSCSGNGTMAVSIAAATALDEFGNLAQASTQSAAIAIVTPLLPAASEWTALLQSGLATAEMKSGMIARAREAYATTLSILAADTSLTAAQASDLAAALTPIQNGSRSAVASSAEALTALSILAGNPSIGATTIGYAAFGATELQTARRATGFVASAQYPSFLAALASMATGGVRTSASAVISDDLDSLLVDVGATASVDQALAYLCHALAVGAVTGSAVTANQGTACVFSIALNTSLDSSVGIDYSDLSFVGVADATLLSLKWTLALARSQDFHASDYHSRDFLAGCASSPCVLDMTGADFSGADFSGATLTGAIFADANLTSVSWSTADLRAVDFRSAVGVKGWEIASASSLVGAHLDGLSFTNMNLSPLFTTAQMSALALGGYNTTTYFDGADVSGASLAWADLSLGSFDKTVMTSTHLKHAILDDSTGLTGSMLQSAADVDHLSLKNVSLSGADLHGLNLTGVVADGADLSSANLAATRLDQGSFLGATLTDLNFTTASMSAAVFADKTSTSAGADFSGSTLSGIDFTNWDLAGVSFSGADLHGAKFNSAYLSGSTATANVAPVDFTGANLTDVDFTGATVGDNLGSGGTRRVIQLFGATLNGTKLSGLNLTSCDLSESIISSPLFVGTNLNGAIFADATGDLGGALSQALSFTNVDLSGLDLTGADFTGKNLSTVKLDLANLSAVTFTGATLPNILLGYDELGVDVSYTSGQSKAQFNSLLDSVASDSKVQVNSSTKWTDGSAVR